MDGRVYDQSCSLFAEYHKGKSTEALSFCQKSSGYAEPLVIDISIFCGIVLPVYQYL